MRNDELLDVVKVTEKTLRKGEESVKKTKNSYIMYRWDMHGSESGPK